MSGVILVLNAGSSSIKFTHFPSERRPARSDVVCEGEYEGLGHRVHFTAKNGVGNPLINEDIPEAETHEDIVAALLPWLEVRFPEEALVAAGHRVVHGGSLCDTGSRASAWVIPTDEGPMIARHTWRLIDRARGLTIQRCAQLVRRTRDT